MNSAAGRWEACSHLDPVGLVRIEPRGCVAGGACRVVHALCAQGTCCAQETCACACHRFRHYSCRFLLPHSPWVTLLWARHVPINSCCFPRAIASVITLVVSIGYIRLLPQASAFQASCLCIAFGIYPAVYRIPHRGPTPISLSFASIMRLHLFI